MLIDFGSHQEKIAHLKNITALSFLKCRKALMECDWDVTLAFEKLRNETRDDRYCLVNEQRLT